MLFDEREEGDFRIYTAAIATREGSFKAAAVIMQVRGTPEPTEIFRDEEGRVCNTPEEALDFAEAAAKSFLHAPPAPGGQVGQPDGGGTSINVNLGQTLDRCGAPGGAA